MSSARRNVIVTGISGRLGRLVAQRLHREPDIHIIGIDRRPFPGKPKDIELHHLDIRSKRARDLFRQRQASALIHMGLLHDRRHSPRELYSWN
ncbi:MAG: NAD-dependent epimerase/dehydratase family protein, partial [Deltaproteobacteria bacterium]|nr:NAD-dependent epimerase/dehydratase family protein [Deltaproteobacteria bacterium]